MELVLVSFFAGVLTVLAPCILPVLPIIVGGSLANNSDARKRAFLIVGSLAVSIVVFTLLLKATTALLGVPLIVWQLISGGILVLLGIGMAFPSLWDKVSISTIAALGAQQLFASASRTKGFWNPILIGMSLGPVFSSCSPTYAYIVAAILPASFVSGTLLLIVYALGLASVMLLLALAGQKVIKNLRWAVDPHGIFKRSIGFLFILIGILVVLGADKQVQTFVLEKGLYAPIEQLEMNLPH